TPGSRGTRGDRVARWIPGGEAEESALLQALGLSRVDELFTDVPRQVRIGRMGVGGALDEPDVVMSVDKILDRNRPYAKFSSFLGGRITPTAIPAAVDAVLSRSEFYTAYTPYQPEASQGILQALFEFQSLWVELTGLDAANASLYDGATAAGEALLLAHRIHEGRRFLVPASLPWEEKSVLHAYSAGLGISVEEIPFDPRTGRLDLGALAAALQRGDVFGMLADLPNGFGVVDDGLPELKAQLKDIPLVVVADPLALTVLEPPAAWGADIVVGEGQCFGMAPSFGGPLLGLFACRREHLRLTPGRIVGATVDAEGRRAFTLTLQTREQHIRRSRATSNICTNQSLLALAFLTYASVIGPQGLARLQTQIAEKARTLASALAAVDGLEAPHFDAPYLGAFTVGLQRGAVPAFLDRLRRKKVLAGIPLVDPRPGAAPAGGEWFLTAASASTTEKDIAKFQRAARASISSRSESP
ncbi:MAG TPA: aminomethyl-transferring glycine dehydrogenase subunit GcvPA, partial [Thermoplasmata archaeon]|nr:aminomethyl-transferring glycine dehydrogenase subunit GcvPA [Thermoplasmata archaeon]